MRTFDASLSTVALWIAVVVPPVFFFLLVQVVDNAMSRGELGIGGWMLLIALSQLLPLVALLWILFSASAYTIAPGKLIVHRVAADREIPLEPRSDIAHLNDGVITVRVPEQGEIRLRVQQPQLCLSELEKVLRLNTG